MLFNSYEFIFVFLPITFITYYWLNSAINQNTAQAFLVVASLFFYSWWNLLYLPILVTSIFFNFFVGGYLRAFLSRDSAILNKRALLVVGIIINVSLLVYFKYADFLIENTNNIAGTTITPLNLALPLAISFFTFQQIAYLVDCYRGDVSNTSFSSYVVFVCFFPQLIAGPIVHNREMIPQFSSSKNSVINYKNISVGLFIFSIGLFKKVAIADTFAIWATAGFDTATTLQFVEAWAVSLSYTFQLYFDFSGYTDMAIGLALLFNINLPINFNSPYKATNIQEFWRRWHITLSRFLRDYVYIPLGGNRDGEVRTHINIIATFLIGGLWHGAGWTFVFWGFLHGMALVIHRVWTHLDIRLWSWISWLLTFVFVIVAWVFFRASEWGDAIKVLRGMSGINGIRLPEIIGVKLPVLNRFGIEFGNSLINIRGTEKTLIWVTVAIPFVLIFKNTVELRKCFEPSLYSLFLTIFCFLTAFFMLNQVSEFLYFNF